MMRRPGRLARVGLLALCATPAAAYYHYVHYLNSSSPYAVAFEKFDLTGLPNKTVTFFVSDSGPTSYAANDSFPSVLAQIRNATQVWNAVASSDLRVAFGGLQAADAQQNAPAGIIVFDDQMPPGVLAFAGHAVSSTVAAAPDGTQFLPIVQSMVHLNANLAQPAAANPEGYTGPSYSESFFTTLVHEIGHALGLQHTYTAAAMSTAVSRATNRARPIDADDVAGISLLYPRAGFMAGFGSISGQVTMQGQPLHMASVVAILPNGSAVSSLTLPDGTYEIDGLPPGNYWVYVHPLPPTSDIQSPVDSSNNPILPSQPFVSTFYPGTWDPTQFTSIAVAQGAAVTGINFAVQPRSAVEVYDVTSYWYSNPASSYDQPAFLNLNTAVQTVVAQGNGITSGPDSTPVTNVTALGAPGGSLPEYSQQVYADADTSLNVSVDLLAMYFDYTATPAAGPEHLLFILPDDIYVLPQAIQMVQNPAPAITGVTPNSDGSVTVTGAGLAADSSVFFDSLPGQVTVPYAADSTGGASGSVSVMPPPGASSQTATITVFNSDGQNSTFLQSGSAPAFSYPQVNAPSATLSLAGLPQGASAMIQVTGSNMQFAGGLTTLGFGSSDVTVPRVWVLSPTTAIANVIVSPSAATGATVASVISGFQVYEQSPGFHIVPAEPALPLLNLPVANAFSPVQNSLYPGAIASILGQNLVADSGKLQLTVSGQTAQILYSSATQINFVVPATINVGPAVLALNNGRTDAYPVVLQIDPQPPVIVSVTATGGAVLDGSVSATPGASITLAVTGLPSAVASAPNRVAITEGGINIPAFTIQQATDGSGNLLISFALTASVTGQQVPVTISLDGDLSMPFYINVAATVSSSN
ncbi:MAG TPA: matrixin family metalloprotease [Bryobacteraceae bacterium]|nr:matrixin family metalloprotease [Bryobacteraceae bacterium]